MSVRQITVEQARQCMEAHEDVVYIDVRTPMEFEKGHPPGAINIPVAFPNPHTRQMMENPDFLKIVEKHVPKARKVIVGCQMGGRSQLAAEFMAGAGYADVSNMQGGFGGARNPMEGVAVPGWVQLGYDVETEAASGARYEELQRS